MIDNDDIIRHSADEEQWADFERRIEMMRPVELNELNSRLNAGVADNSDWEYYRDAFCEYSWRQYTEAYEYATNSSY